MTLIQQEPESMYIPSKNRAYDREDTKWRKESCSQGAQKLKKWTLQTTALGQLHHGDTKCYLQDLAELILARVPGSHWSSRAAGILAGRRLRSQQISIVSATRDSIGLMEESSNGEMKRWPRTYALVFVSCTWLHLKMFNYNNVIHIIIVNNCKNIILNSVEVAWRNVPSHSMKRHCVKLRAFISGW